MNDCAALRANVEVSIASTPYAQSEPTLAVLRPAGWLTEENHNLNLPQT